MAMQELPRTTPEAESRLTDPEVIAGGAAMMAVGGAAALALCIIALAGVSPLLLVEIAEIVAGGTMLLGAVGGGARAKQAHGEARTITGTSASFELVGGLGGVVLGILAIVGVSPAILVEIAAIGLGGALLFSSMLPARPGLFGLHDGHVRLAGESAGAVQALAGIGAVTLAILALVGILPRDLTTIAVLGVGAGLMLTGAAIAAGSFAVRSHA